MKKARYPNIFRPPTQVWLTLMFISASGVDCVGVLLEDRQVGELARLERAKLAGHADLARGRRRCRHMTAFPLFVELGQYAQAAVRPTMRS